MLVSAHGNCKKFFAPELPHSECASHAIDRLDIFCETITWQWEELGDHSHDVWPVSACPLPTRKNEAGSARTGHELNKAQSPLHKELKTLEQELDAVLQGKVGDKSQAAVLWNRTEGNGIYARAPKHKLDIQTFGQGVMVNRTRAMYPKEIHNVETMMYEVQARLDEC